MNILTISAEEYGKYVVMRSSLKKLVTVQLCAENSEKAERWLQNHRYILYQLVEDASRKIMADYGRPTQKSDVLIPTAVAIAKILRTGYIAKYQD